MTPERWHRVTEIFHSALEQPPSDAEEFLRAQCGGDEELYAEVGQMLQEHARTGEMDHGPWAAAPARASASMFSPGQTVSGRYRIVRFLNRGGMGEVYEAEDLELKERVAVKTLLPEIASDARMISRFKNEIQLARKIAHPNVCRVFDLARHPADGSSPDTTYFLTMEYLAGETLAGLLEREGRMTPETALPLLEQMAEGLDAAHRAGVIHRDFKPSNVMLVRNGERVRAVVTDFGLARKHSTGESTATITGKVMGTVDYMAPELFSGAAASVASDVYALGLVAYKMIAGRLPLASDTPSKLLVPDLDSTWERAIARALDPDPARRFSSAIHLIKAMRGQTASVTVALPAMTRPRIAAVVAALLFLIAGTLGIRSWRRSRNQPSAEAVTFYRRGADDIHAGAYFAATKALQQAVNLAPRYGLAHARLAEAWVELELPEKASREMLLARREDNSGLAPTDRLQIEATDLTITREFAAAVAKYEQMLRLAGSQDANIQVDLGRAYEKAAQPPKAIDMYRRAAEGSEHNPAAWLRLAVLYSRSGDSAKSAEAFGKTEELYQITSNLAGLTEVAYQRGIDANRRRRLDEGAAFLRKALETARLAGNIHQAIRAELQFATNAYLLGDAALAERYSHEALEAAETNQIEGLAISGIINLGNAHLLKGDYTRAESAYRDALTLARRNASSRLAALGLLSLAALHDRLKRSEETVREATEALALFEPNGYALESAQCLTLIGRVQRNRGELTAALESFQRSLQMAEKAQDRARIALGHDSMGSLLSAMEDYPRALEHYQKNLDLSNGEPKGYAGLQCGYTLCLLGRYEEARNAFAGADAIANAFPVLRLQLLRARAEMALTENRFAEAAVAARKALADRSQPSAFTSAHLTQILGLALLGSGNRREGLRYCERSLAALAQLDSVDEVLSARLALAKAKLETGDRAGAVALLHLTEPAFATHPESRWRSLALMARADTSYAAGARQALDDLGRAWGASAFEAYLTRPDIRELSRPLLKPVSANNK
jgi:tRNA A-37 threonylcarbamoyl transferase component Bud32/Tfp pilus assembly protein PilF